MRGGYRPGAGRKRGSKDTKPRKGSAAAVEAEKIKAMLAMGAKAKARFYQEFLIRVSKGETLSISEKKMMDKLAVELSADLTEDEKVEAIQEELDPLSYMLKVMNDPTAEKDRRDKMAIAAAPFIHARKGEGQGKKDDKADRAQKAGQGKFAPGKAPLKVVK